MTQQSKKDPPDAIFGPFGIGYWVVSADSPQETTTESPAEPVTPDPNQPPYQRDDLTVEQQRQAMINNMRSAFNGET